MLEHSSVINFCKLCHRHVKYNLNYDPGRKASLLTKLPSSRVGTHRDVSFHVYNKYLTGKEWERKVCNPLESQESPHPTVKRPLTQQWPQNCYTETWQERHWTRQTSTWQKGDKIFLGEFGFKISVIYWLCS